MVEGGQCIQLQMLPEVGVCQVPQQYIQPPLHRPKLNEHKEVDKSSITLNIPTVDLLRDHETGNSSDVNVREAIRCACREWGAFHVVNHGIPNELLHQMRSMGHSFFKDFPLEAKLKYACDPNSAASEGYGTRMLLPSQDAAVLDWREYFDHHTFPLSRRNPSHWPSVPPDYRHVVAEYSEQMKRLAQILLGLISESLSLPFSCLEKAVGEIYQNITVSYYPPCPQPDLTLGLQRHSDMGAITLLIQDDVCGLQVFKDGEWITVHPLSDAIVVILSDQTEIITNGAYKSAEHRALTNRSRPRLSVATFHDPAKTVTISPAMELLSEASPAQYNKVEYGEYKSSWYSKGPEGRRNLDKLMLK